MYCLYKPARAGLRRSGPSYQRLTRSIKHPAGKPETDARPDIADRRRFGQRPKPARIHLQRHGFGAPVIVIDLNDLKFSGTSLAGVKQEDVDLLEHQ
jgi:hypothetical protein